MKVSLLLQNKRQLFKVFIIAIIWTAILIRSGNVTVVIAGSCPTVNNTPFFSIVYGTVFVDGNGANVGSIVEARSPRNDLVGCFEVTSSGNYGLMYVYGEDNSVTPVIPGMRSGETVDFYVDGVLATPSTPFVWTNDQNFHEISLVASESGHDLSIADVTVLEGTGGSTTAIFTVTLSPVSEQEVSVDYTTENGTAFVGSDYTTVSGTLFFNPGESTQTIAVPIVTDALDEPDETFVVSLSKATNASVSDSVAIGTIVDDDGPPTLTINDVVVTEGTGGNMAATFNVTLSPVGTSEVVVHYVTANDTAVADEDFDPKNGSLTFLVGQTSKEIVVPIISDNVDEGISETFSMQLLDPTNATIADSIGQATIVDDDTASLSLDSDPQVVEGNSSLTPLTFTVSVSTPAAFEITTDYVISSGSGDNGAVASIDFSGTLNGILTFQSGETVKMVTIDIIGDEDIESDEHLDILIKNANVGISKATATGLIINDDEEKFEVFLPFIIR